jgi:hypothetical protein
MGKRDEIHERESCGRRVRMHVVRRFALENPARTRPPISIFGAAGIRARWDGRFEPTADFSDNPLAREMRTKRALLTLSLQEGQSGVMTTKSECDQE